MGDEEIVERQLGRRPRAFRRVAVRCPFGRPAVTEQAPFDADGHPFPTQYYVTCPALVAAIWRVEAARIDRRRYRELVRGVELVVDRLRQRVGQTFTIEELAAAYDGADVWALELLDAADPDAPVPTEPGTVTDAAFHAYARGAL